MYSTTIIAELHHDILIVIPGIVEWLNDPELRVHQAATDALARLVHDGLQYLFFIVAALNFICSYFHHTRQILIRCLLAWINYRLLRYFY